ncbi:MAG: hypothetical protein WBA28_02880 [Microbacteriaceae bacterium]
MIFALMKLRLQDSVNIFRVTQLGRMRQLVLIVLRLMYFLLVPTAISWVWGAYSIPEGIRQSNTKIALIGTAIALLHIAYAVLRDSDPLDSRKLIGLGAKPEKLELALPLATMASVQFVLFAVLSIGIIAKQVSDPISGLFAIIIVLLIFGQTALHIRLGSIFSSLVLSKLRVRRLLIFVLSIALLIEAVVMWAWVTTTNEIVVWVSLESLMNSISYVPIVSPWMAVGYAGKGDWEGAWILCILALVYLGLLWALWRWAFYLKRTMAFKPDRANSDQQLAWFGVLPANRSGAIAARGLSYWLNDPRYVIPALAIPALPIFIVLVLWLVGLNNDYLYLVPVPLMSLMLGWSIHNDTATDGIAFWIHLSSAKYEKADRLGRMLPLILIWLPLMLAGAALSAWLAHNWWYFPIILGVSAAAFGSALGTSSIASVRFAYPTTRPHDSPFRQPIASGPNSAFAQGLVLLIAALFTAIPTGLYWWGSQNNNTFLYLLTLIIGVSIGLLMIWIGTRVGAKSLRKRGPELLAIIVES